MSVQLILYPQNYQGVYASNSSVITTNLVADGARFNTIANHTGYSSSANDPAFDAITNDAPTSNWKKFRSQGSGSFADVDYPCTAFESDNLEKQAKEAENNQSPPWQQGNKRRRKWNPNTNQYELLEKYKEN